MPELGTLGSVRGVASNGHPYRDKTNFGAPMLSVLQKAIRPVSRSRETGRPRVVGEPGMQRRLLLGNRDISGLSLRSFCGDRAGKAGGRSRR